MDLLSLENGFWRVWLLGNMASGVPLDVKDANREGAFGHAKELVDDLAPNEDTARLIEYSVLRVI
jgi:hypothetical protein